MQERRLIFDERRLVWTCHVYLLKGVYDFSLFFSNLSWRLIRRMALILSLDWFVKCEILYSLFEKLRAPFFDRMSVLMGFHVCTEAGCAASSTGAFFSRTNMLWSTSLKICIINQILDAKIQDDWDLNVV